MRGFRLIAALPLAAFLALAPAVHAQSTAKAASGPGAPAASGPATMAAPGIEAQVVPAAPDQPALPSGLDISSQVDRSEITIGDRIQYEIKVVYPGEGRIELPSVIGNLGSFEVKDYQASDPKPAGNLKIQTWRFNLSTFTVGQYMIPPQQVVYLPKGAVMPVNPGAADSAAGKGPLPLVFFTQPIEIKVVRTSAETVQDIADIATLAELDEPLPWIPIAVGAAVLLALLAFFLRRRRGKAAAPEAERPPLPPYEEAMEKLAGLNPGQLIRQNRARELAFDLSEVLRRYISRRYEADALESTTTEFLRLVPKLPVTAAQRQWIEKFCEGTDMVKFAGSPMLESDGSDLLNGLKDFLNQTRPRETDGEGKAAKAPPPGIGSGPAAHLSIKPRSSLPPRPPATGYDSKGRPK